MLKEMVRYPLSIKRSSSPPFAEIHSPYDGGIVAAIEQADAASIETSTFIGH